MEITNAKKVAWNVFEYWDEKAKKETKEYLRKRYILVAFGAGQVYLELEAEEKIKEKI